MKKGITFGAFDLVHAGHVVFFKECKKQCDYLVVGLHANPHVEREEKHKPVQTLFERYIQLKSCKHVNEIIPYETEQDVLNMLHVLNADIRFVGTDYKVKDITGSDIVLIEYIPREHSYSSTELRERIKRS